MKSNTNKFLVLILILQTFILMGQWFGGPVTPALAQIPDAGEQRQELITILKGTNEKLDKVISILDSGKLQVQTTKPDDSEKK